MFWNSVSSIWMPVLLQRFWLCIWFLYRSFTSNHVSHSVCQENDTGALVAWLYHSVTFCAHTVAQKTATCRGLKASSIYVCVQAQIEETDLVICSLLGVFYDLLVLGWCNSTRKHRWVDFTLWVFFKLMELLMCTWTRSEIMAVFMEFIQRDSILSVCQDRNM